MKFSILIVTFNRKKIFFECLQSISIQSQVVPFEVIVVLNGDLTNLDKYKSNFPQFKFIHITQTTKANARNIAINKAQGEYLYFLGDDCILPDNHFKKINFDLNWDVLGGPDLPSQKASNLQAIFGAALASPLCMGPSFKRHSRHSSYENKATEGQLNIGNLWFKKSIFTEDEFKFNGLLFKNEEHYLLKEVLLQNKIIHYDPNLFVYLERTPHFEKLGAALIRSGKCRALTFFTSPNKMDLIYFSPWIFLALIFFNLFNPNFFFMTSIILYIGVIFILGITTIRRPSLYFVLLHFFILTCYNIGLIKGCWISFGNICKKTFIKI